MLDIVNWGITIAIIKLTDISISEEKVERIAIEIESLKPFLPNSGSPPWGSAGVGWYMPRILDKSKYTALYVLCMFVHSRRS